MITQQPNQSLPEIIRVKALRGFRGHINGRFGVANPGDVVEVPRALAMEMRAVGRAVMTAEDLGQQSDYLPERKKPGNAKAADPVQAQLSALTKAIEGMAKVVEGQTKALEALAKKQ